MGKRVSIMVLLLVASLGRGYGTIITAATGGGTFSAGATWIGGVAPATGDTVVIPSTCTGNITVTGGVTVGKLDCTGYTKTLTLSGATLTVSGNITLSSATGFLFTGTGTLQVSANATIMCNGAVIDAPLRFSGSNCTFTLSGDVACSKLVSLTPSSNSSTCTYTAATGSERLIAKAGLTISGPSSVTTVQGSAVFEVQGGTLTGGGTVVTIRNSINLVPSVSAITIATGGTGLSYSTGTISYTPSTFGITHTSNNVLTITGTCGLNTAGLAWENITVTTGSTITLGSLLQVSRALTHSTSGAITYAGTGGWTVGTFTATTAGNVTTLTTGVTHTITTGIATTGTAASAVSIASSSGVKTVLTLQQGATEDCLYTNVTAVDCSGGKTLWITKPSIAASNNVLSRPMEPAQMAGAN